MVIPGSGNYTCPPGRKKQAISRFDVIGVGKAWGNQMKYVRREIRLDP
jgi:hypothetical protein